MDSRLERANFFIKNHWNEKDFVVCDLFMEANNTLLINFSFTEIKDDFILHGSDTYRLAQYILLVHIYFFMSENPYYHELFKKNSNPEKAISLIQIVKSNISFHKPILNGNNIKLKSSLKCKVGKHRFSVAHLNISINDGHHKIVSEAIIHSPRTALLNA